MDVKRDDKAVAKDTEKDSSAERMLSTQSDLGRLCGRAKVGEDDLIACLEAFHNLDLSCGRAPKLYGLPSRGIAAGREFE